MLNSEEIIDTKEVVNFLYTWTIYLFYQDSDKGIRLCVKGHMLFEHNCEYQEEIDKLKIPKEIEGWKIKGINSSFFISEDLVEYEEDYDPLFIDRLKLQKICEKELSGNIKEWLNEIWDDDRDLNIIIDKIKKYIN